jgi:hypothetical protein
VPDELLADRLGELARGAIEIGADDRVGVNVEVEPTAAAGQPLGCARIVERDQRLGPGLAEDRPDRPAARGDPAAREGGRAAAGRTWPRGSPSRSRAS